MLSSYPPSGLWASWEITGQEVLPMVEVGEATRDFFALFFMGSLVGWLVLFFCWRGSSFCWLCGVDWFISMGKSGSRVQTRAWKTVWKSKRDENELT